MENDYETEARRMEEIAPRELGSLLRQAEQVREIMDYREGVRLLKILNDKIQFKINNYAYEEAGRFSLIRDNLYKQLR